MSSINVTWKSALMNSIVGTLVIGKCIICFHFMTLQHNVSIRKQFSEFKNKLPYVHVVKFPYASIVYV